MNEIKPFYSQHKGQEQTLTFVHHVNAEKHGIYLSPMDLVFCLFIFWAFLVAIIIRINAQK
ncbi:MAG: hypothetical protein CVU11_14045 [Bacteroidetes bacterium HGW-Bacteroidetes-6]|jgi:hypothetical protein|nr:MAG: hypothetical protein CVU11_14045 [Bacteroidetes bacterium HGW-Bacteroidetes-6]